MREGEKGSEMKQMNANGREGDFVVADVVHVDASNTVPFPPLFH
jgi:hypothetical protein